MPLRVGYSRDVISANIGEMMRDGVEKANATAAAFALGRVSFFKRHPHGALPTWLAFPSNYRLRQHYDRKGAPLLHPGNAIQRNPARRGELVRAARRFARFTGNNDVTTRKIRVSAPDKIVLAVGPCDGLLYTTKRDGRVEKYIHRFKRKSRPLLAASPDGKRLYLLGGAYTFTDRGIVDRR